MGGDGGPVRFLVTGGADDDGFAALGAESGDGGGHIVETEIDHGVATVDRGAQIIALIDLAGYLQVGKPGGTGDEGLAHATFGTGDDEASHGGQGQEEAAVYLSTPQAFKVPRRISRCLECSLELLDLLAKLLYLLPLVLLGAYVVKGSARYAQSYLMAAVGEEALGIGPRDRQFGQPLERDEAEDRDRRPDHRVRPDD